MVQLGSAGTVTEADVPSLLRHLERVPDPRIRRGRRHPLAYVLALAACAVLAGARSLTAIAEWAADLPRDRLARTGARVLDPEPGLACRPPSEATFRRVLQRLDGDALDSAISSYLRERAHHQPEKKELVQVAVDGKTLRGAVHPDGSQVHLISALRMDGVVLAQREVPSKTNEITAFKPLLTPLDLENHVITFDTLLTQTDLARFLVEDKKAHYIAVLKANHPRLHQLVKELPWRDVPFGQRSRDTSGGRNEIRRLKAAAMTRLPFPHAAQASRSSAAPSGTGRPPSTAPMPSPAWTPSMNRRTTRGIRETALVDREQGTPCPRRDVRRGCLPRPHRHRTPRHGRPA
ncbi:ISAs1 family transposase [Streptomyces sp. NPDC090499]|uniref:ISAs1 family transposase n=1 Tax=Streptomyces sp. NPDC090499 TaxID=3365965 RepID=UPI0038052CE3